MGSTRAAKINFGNLDHDGFVWAEHDVLAWPELWAKRAKAGQSDGIFWLSIIVGDAAEFSRQNQKTAAQTGTMIGGGGNPALIGCTGTGQASGGTLISLAVTKKALQPLMAPLRGTTLPKALARLSENGLPELVAVPPDFTGMDMTKWAEELRIPPGPRFTHPLFFQAKALEAFSILAGAAHARSHADGESLVSPEESQAPAMLAASTRRERRAQERIVQVQALITANMEEPLNLVELSRRVGCSPYHLSRTFSTYAGCTLQEYQRRIRLRRAAELLRGGKHNVTEAALAVGYSSFSHFTKTFRETFGCCPGLYPVLVGTKVGAFIAEWMQ